MPPPAYFDYSQSLAAAWDVWSSTVAGRDTVERVARQRLGALQAFACAQSPFYRRLYRGLDAGECALASLPPVTRTELMAHFDEVVTDRDVTRIGLDAFLEDRAAIGTPFLGRYAAWVSSGTTGEPSAWLHDGHALAVYDALQLLRFRSTSVPRVGERFALVGATGNHFAGVASIERLRHLQPWLAGGLRVFSILEPISVLTRTLNDYRPTLLATYATACCELADEQACGRLRIAPREIWSGGECLSDKDCSHIESAFGCRVRNEYGASEFPSIAWQCAHGSLHANTDWVLLEAVDENSRAVPPGTASHTVLLTNLANRVQPLLRCDLGDSITWFEQPCSCGSRLPALRLEGRSDEALVLRTANGQAVKLLPLALTTVLEEQAGVYRFQLRPNGSGRLVLDLDLGCHTDAPRRCRRALLRYLRSQGLANIRLTVRRRALQPHPSSGKLQRVSR